MRAAGEEAMQLGMIGLGRMGGNIVRRLMKDGHHCVVFDKSHQAVEQLVGEGALGSGDLAQFVRQLEKPRAVWVMLPAGAITDETIVELGQLLEKGDIVIDGGNSFYQEDIRHAKLLAPKGIRFLDVGTSGGVWGLERGYCMMIGGDEGAFTHLDPIFKTLAPGMGTIERTPTRKGRNPRAEEGYIYCGPHGAGHFVKMVHNGIEYGIMQAYAEGFDILRNVAGKGVPEERRYNLDLADIAEVWRRGSVVASWLLDLSAIALASDDQLSDFSGFVEDSGEGRWTIQAAIEEAVPADVLSAALYTRFRSRQEHTFAEKLLSAMRKEFGGHQEPPGSKGSG
jgi:6-phosphogluconate dehydrogenase